MLWGEDTRSRRRSNLPKGQSGRPRAHPHAATEAELRQALGDLGGADENTTADRILVQLPTVNGSPMPSPEAAVLNGHLGDATPTLTSWRVPALTFDATRAAELLLLLGDEELSADRMLGDDLRFWSVATRFAFELLYRQRLAPTVRKDGESYLARWEPVLDDDDAQRFARLERSMPPVCRAPATELSPRALLNDYLETVVDTVARQACAPLARRRRKSDRWPPNFAWMEALKADPAIQAEAGELGTFHQEFREWVQAAPSAGASTFRVCFRLDPPEAAEYDGKPDDWSLRYLLQATDDPSLLVPAAEVWRQRGSTARFLKRKLEGPHERLLAGLGGASRVFPPIESSLHTATPESCALTTSEAYDFFREKALLLKANGYGVLVPDLQQKLGVRVRLGVKPTSRQNTAGPARFGWNSLVDYDWQLALGDQTLSRAEFEALANLKEPLVQIRGQWVELRPEQIQQALAALERSGDGQMALGDALKLALAPNGDYGLPVVGVETEGSIGEMIRTLRAVDGAKKRDMLGEPAGFVGQLRAYQTVGLSWLASLRRFGLGACLADDMGLGKTIQLIALLLHRSDEDNRPWLLICPTSVVGNWRHELSRFAPQLRVLVHHGADRTREGLAESAAQHDVVISTYALLYRDETELRAIDWEAVVLDEAQNIKNPSTKHAQAARRLPAQWRAALTGTPIENRLSELWSIFQFLNPGYLGSAEEFRKRFALPIERLRDPGATERLKALVSPFILRRLKTDRSIIQDLPEKNEMKVFCTLTREQATLYEAVLKDAMRQIEESEGIQRRGLILATLAKLKQVCDHPALFLHDGSTLLGRSGKLARLVEMLEESLAVGDRALLFTQYAEMGRLLQHHLEATFGGEVLFLHGGTPAKQRDRMVARFQQPEHGPRLFVLSLKAGGTGLNLTRANHVFHFDRWWNPAVEEQATDRAFRIGQRRDVQVHKFICAGTFEEPIDALIDRKRQLSESIVGTSEAWLTEMSTDELRDLFALRRDAIQE
jgi:SNF2 family DNA or RNA helicase